MRMHKLAVHLKAGLFLAPALAAMLLMSHLGATAEDLIDVAARLAATNLDHGRKLYENNCDACHTTNLHWRDKRLVDSWVGLLQQVDRWQRNSGQSWEPDDIKDVAAYLNARFYQLPCPANECADNQASLRAKDARINL
jgi:mono/diheme cytochrome c family protein